jgi:hypothetical protein
VKKLFSLENEWFSSKAQITTFLVEEILSTKFRALLQRDKGRDVFDLGRAIDEFDGMDLESVVKGMTHYLDMSGAVIHRAAAEERLFNKLKTMSMLDDMRALVPASQRHIVTEESAKKAIGSILCCLVGYLPGRSWANSSAMIKEMKPEPFLGQNARGCPRDRGVGRTV